jgi:hypothetical protein
MIREMSTAPSKDERIALIAALKARTAGLERWLDWNSWNTTAGHFRATASRRRRGCDRPVSKPGR